MTRRWTAALVALVFIGSCAKPKPHVTPTARDYVDLPASESGVVESEDNMDITIPAFDPLTAAGPADALKARFRGKDRAGAKTSIATGSTENFASVVPLLASIPADSLMLNHTPQIQKNTNTRATEEERNVRVPAWIYAMKYEPDQDWHIIIGTDPSASGAKAFFNAEISGLPAATASSFGTLQAARNSLGTLLNNNLPGSAGFRKFNTPMPVTVEGSLFFDVDHPAGAVGPTNMRPTTAWEIHPITKLTPR
jgi:hypothetical protein